MVQRAFIPQIQIRQKKVTCEGAAVHCMPKPWRQCKHLISGHSIWKKEESVCATHLRSQSKNTHFLSVGQDILYTESIWKGRNLHFVLQFTTRPKKESVVSIKSFAQFTLRSCVHLIVLRGIGAVICFVLKPGFGKCSVQFSFSSVYYYCLMFTFSSTTCYTHYFNS